MSAWSGARVCRVLTAGVDNKPSLMWSAPLLASSTGGQWLTVLPAEPQVPVALRTGGSRQVPLIAQETWEQHAVVTQGPMERGPSPGFLPEKQDVQLSARQGTDWPPGSVQLPDPPVFPRRASTGREARSIKPVPARRWKGRGRPAGWPQKWQRPLTALASPAPLGQANGFSIDARGQEKEARL